jgi:phospholipase/lecithinase/hemolysin
MNSLWKTGAAALIVMLVPLSVQARPHWPAHSFHDNWAWRSHGSPFERIFTFGDSLSDPGNAFVATGNFVVRPFDPIPDAPYLIGRFHFSNGPTWIEWLARDLRLYLSGRPALLRPGIYTDYAIGGARARPPADPVDLDTEIGLFLHDFDGVASPDALYAVWIGANDLRDALEQLPDLTESLATIATAVGATHDGIERLWKAGASSFLVLNLPDLSIAPAITTLNNDDVTAAARFLSIRYNAELEAALDQLEAEHGQDIVIARLDVFTILDDAVADPASVGLTNVTDSCITAGVIRGAICRHPDTYLFWDNVHPTTEAHRLVGEDAKASLAETFGGFEASPVIGAR